MSIADEKYVAFTTYRKNGEPKSLPVWIVDVGDGTVGFTTASSSYKVKRLRNDPRVVLQPSDAKGNIKEGSSEVTGTGEVRTGADFETTRDKVKAKYGIQFTLINLIGNLAKLFRRGSGTDTAIAITLDE
ncbi:MAG: PPOX class F420-dependent oxidoreductase [Actinomycetota bacterium]